MSHFMSSMPPAGLMVMPPVSNVTPLPMNATGLSRLCLAAAVASHCITTMRGSFTLPCATPSSAPKPSFVISFGPSTSTFRPSRVSFLQRSAISAGFSTFGGSLTRSRVRNTPLATPASGSHADLPPRRVGIQHGQLGQLRLVLRLLLGAVAIEAIGAQHRAERHLAPPAPACSASAAIAAAGSRASARRRCRRPPAEHSGIELGRLAQADDDHARQTGAGRQDGAGLALAALELRRRQRAGDRAAGRLVSLLPQPAGLLALAHQQHQRAGSAAARVWRRRCRAWLKTPMVLTRGRLIAARTVCGAMFAMHRRATAICCGR